MLIVELPSPLTSPKQVPTAPIQRAQSPSKQSPTSQIPIAQIATVAPHASSVLTQRGVPVWAWAVGGATAAVVLILIGVLTASFFMAPASAPVDVASNSSPQTTASIQPTAVSPPSEPKKLNVAAPMESSQEQSAATTEANHSAKTSTPEPAAEPAIVAKAEPAMSPAKSESAAKEEVIPLFEKNEEAVTESNNTPPTTEIPEPATEEKAVAPEAKIVVEPNNAPIEKEKYNYNLKDKVNYDYQFEFSLAGDGTKIEPTKGQVSYSKSKHAESIRAQESLTEQAFKPLPARGSASAFVVNADGWLITCAHCTRNMDKIEATINGRSYMAKVVQVDDTHDLALLKIEAKNLATIPLVTRDVAQGEDANVAGFPLGNVLGNSMKITYGRIAGFVNEKGERWLQLDTSINPGNSGGPVLGSKGEVIGVVSGALRGDRIDRVGLATEIGPVRELLKKNKVANAEVENATSLSSTELAKRVTKSIVQLSLGMRDKSSSERFLVDYYGWTSPSDAYNHVNGTIGMTTKGEFVSQEGQSDSTLFSTSIGMLAFEELPPDGMKQWQNVRQRSISYLTDIPRNNAMIPPGYTSRYYRNPYAMMQPFQNVVLGQVVIDDTIDCEIIKTEGTVITVKTKTKSIWSGPSRTKEVGSSEGMGEYKFDAKQGVTTFGKSELKLKLTRDNGIETTIPMRLVFKLEKTETDQQRKDRLALASKKSKETRDKYEKERKDNYANAIKTVKNPKSSNEDVQSALSEITHGPDFSSKTPEAEKKDVSPHLNRWLESENDRVRSAALHAVKRFATEANIATLLKLLESTEGHEQGYIIEALGATGGNEKVAKMVARVYAANDHDYHSRHALEKMPKYAEAVVLPMLDTSIEKRKREEIYDILGKVGGRKSYDQLKKILSKRDPDNIGDFQLKNAIKEIGKRLAVKGE